MFCNTKNTSKNRAPWWWNSEISWYTNFFQSHMVPYALSTQTFRVVCYCTFSQQSNINCTGNSNILNISACAWLAAEIIYILYTYQSNYVGYRSRGKVSKKYFYISINNLCQEKTFREATEGSSSEMVWNKYKLLKVWNQYKFPLVWNQCKLLVVWNIYIFFFIAGGVRTNQWIVGSLNKHTGGLELI